MCSKECNTHTDRIHMHIKCANGNAENKAHFYDSKNEVDADSFHIRVRIKNSFHRVILVLSNSCCTQRPKLVMVVVVVFSYLVMSSVLTALGVPGGTAANTFDDAYLDELSKSMRTETKQTQAKSIRL